MLSVGTQRRLTLAILVGVATGVAAWLTWFACRSPSSHFLPPAGGAEWILYPTPPWIAGVAGKYEQRAVCRHTFELAAPPAAAPLTVRAFQRCSLHVNGRPVELPAAEPWSQARTVDVAAYLQAGRNVITAVVTNEVGPPLLWLVLDGPPAPVVSDDRWRVSLDGAVECAAQIASRPPEFRAGNGAAGGDRTLESLQLRWPTLALFAALSAAILVAVRAAARRQVVPRLFGRERSPLTTGLLAAAVLWVALFYQNTFRAPLFSFGFDWIFHVHYMDYIQNRGALPLADEGWEMHQPPLYYLLGAGLLRVCGLTTQDAGTDLVLRLLGLAAGLAQLALVAGCLRLLFPEQPRCQLFGLALAAFLPAQIYTSHYVTNEVLVTVLGTAALYLCLRILRDDRPSPAAHALLGLCLGAALLTKVTALVVAGVVLLVLAGRLVARRESHPGAWLRGLGVTLLVTVLVCGWHYGRVWARFGTPLVGNYDAACGFTWWQQPGYGTAAYLFGFGRVLADPFFSALVSLPGGFYSTFWGDGLCGGVGAWPHRPPWNYDLMAAGMLLALLPSLAILLGLAVTLGRLVRRPRAEEFLLLGVVGGLAAAVLFQVLRYPYHGHARASYLLTAMVPLCAFAALGMDVLARSGRVAAALAAVLLGTWAGAAYASFWIPAGSAATLNWAGEQYDRQKCYLLAELTFRKAVAADPRAVPPRLNLVRALLQSNQPAEARRWVNELLHDEPDNPDALFLLASVCRAEGRPGDGVAPLRRACEVAPDHPLLYSLLGDLLMGLNRDTEAIAAYREALRVTPSNAAEHANLALVLARTGATDEAIAHYRRALGPCPDHTEWLTDLAWLLATREQPSPGDAAEALRLAQEACRLTQERDPVALLVLAAAHAAGGHFNAARDQARRALQLAGQSRQAPLAARIQEQVQHYEKGTPYYSRAPLRAKPYAPLVTNG